jgi:energy-coupling factor transporter ATP-binding protein EcfA2
VRPRDNPFNADRIDAIRYRPLQGTLDDILARLEELAYRAAIVGPDGSGKTTLLHDLQEALESRGQQTKLIFVNDATLFPAAVCRRLLSELTREEVVFLDGADLIARSSWHLFRRHTISHSSGLIITSHRPGLLPTLIECATTLTLLREIAAELAPHSPLVTPTLLDDLYRRHAGNLRACLQALYDLYAKIPN